MTAAWDHGRWVHKSRFGFHGTHSTKHHYFTVITYAIDPERMVGWDVECNVEWEQAANEWSLYFNAASLQALDEGWYSGPLELVPPGEDTWYWFMLDFGVTGVTRMKIWPDDGVTEEPDWMFSFQNYEYSLIDGDGFWSGSSWATTIYQVAIYNQMYPGPNGTSIKWDGHWEVVDEEATTPITMSPGLTSENPTFTGVASSSPDQSQTTTYQTSRSYAAGTLRVDLAGVTLRPGVDFIEVDPDAGTFIMFGRDDLSASITVQYSPSSNDLLPVTPHPVRPVPVTATGYGTALDGMNTLMASAAMALRRIGVSDATPAMVRGSQSDEDGLGTLADIAVAFTNMGEMLEWFGTTSWSDFAFKVNQSRGAILEGDYTQMVAEKRYSEYYTRHFLYINEQMPSGDWLGFDPLHEYGVVYTTEELQAFAVRADGLVNAAFTEITS